LTSFGFCDAILARMARIGEFREKFNIFVPFALFAEFALKGFLVLENALLRYGSIIEILGQTG